VGLEKEVGAHILSLPFSRPSDRRNSNCAHIYTRHSK